MKSLEELKQLKEKMQSAVKPEASNDIRIIVGMATCGLAAGAKPVYDLLNEEVKKRNLNSVKVVQVGCIGMCRLEPLVEVLAPNQPKVTYVKVTPEMASKIMEEHIVGQKIVDEYLITQD